MIFLKKTFIFKYIYRFTHFSYLLIYYIKKLVNSPGEQTADNYTVLQYRRKNHYQFCDTYGRVTPQRRP